MSKDNQSALELSSVIQSLRKDLAIAMKKAEGESIRFDINHIEVELLTTIATDVEVAGGIKFYVEMGGKQVDKEAQSHLIRLNLTPVDPENTDPETGEPNKLPLSSEQKRDR